MFNNRINSKNSGFTLIELLVVVAIIGILSTVVIASLNGAREKGKIAFIKSTLKNMQSQAEITYSDNGNYSNLCDNTSGACLLNATNFCDSISNQGFVVKCFSYDGSRLGITAKLNSDNNKNYSMDQLGVVTWDSVDASDTYGTKNWNGAVSLCASLGRRLPSLEELVSFYNTWNGASPGLHTGYWSSTEVDSDRAFGVNLSTYGFTSSLKTQTMYVRCVR